jgi:hypothetical protein
MKPTHLFLLTAFGLFGTITANAQTVTLAVTQNYTLPDTPVITQNGDLLNSSVSTGNQWYFNGAKIEGATQSSVVVTQSGTYSVTVSNEVGCSAASANYAAIKTDVPVIQVDDFTCKVYPNPNNGLFTVEIESSQSNPLALELFSADGKSVAKQKLKYASGSQTIQFGKANLVGGVYTLQVKFGNRIVSRKLIVKQ